MTRETAIKDIRINIDPKKECFLLCMRHQNCRKIDSVTEFIIFFFVFSYESDRSSRYSKSRSARNSLERDKRDRDRERDGDREREKEISRNKEKEREKNRDLSPVPEDVVKPKSQGNFNIVASLSSSLV